MRSTTSGNTGVVAAWSRYISLCFKAFAPPRSMSFIIITQREGRLRCETPHFEPSLLTHRLSLNWPQAQSAQAAPQSYQTSVPVALARGRVRYSVDSCEIPLLGPQARWLRCPRGGNCADIGSQAHS